MNRSAMLKAVIAGSGVLITLAGSGVAAAASHGSPSLTNEISPRQDSVSAAALEIVKSHADIIASATESGKVISYREKTTGEGGGKASWRFQPSTGKLVYSESVKYGKKTYRNRMECTNLWAGMCYQYLPSQKSWGVLAVSAPSAVCELNWFIEEGRNISLTSKGVKISGADFCQAGEGTRAESFEYYARSGRLTVEHTNPVYSAGSKETLTIRSTASRKLEVKVGSDSKPIIPGYYSNWRVVY